ncbi:MAG: hypothetical protein NVV74_02495 [Magnetospirillum sp.]|nr:hypothetical protein [Magnetospirillum sp.]
MKAVSVFLLAVLACLPAAAKDFDLGYARTGMMLGQFRFAAWPAGLSVRCSDDPDRPKEVDRLLAIPRQMADMGAVRCALLRVDEAGKFSPATRNIGGAPVEVAAMFGPDPQGVKRLVQLFLQGPRSGYDGLVAHFTARLGKPVETTERLVRWAEPGMEAVVLHEDGDAALAMFVDWRLQELMNARMPVQAKR